MARPRKEIDKKDFESLLAIQCSLEEITAFFDNKLDGCSADTIERWCKRTYKKNFAEIAPKKREIGKISIRRAQFRMMEKNASALIWVSKQYLGQTDTVTVVSKVDEDAIKEVQDLINETLGEEGTEQEADS